MFMFLPLIYQNFVGRLVIGNDSYNTWSSRLIVGDRIRTKFSSLTLDLVALNGVRWDDQFGFYCAQGSDKDDAESFHIEPWSQSI